MGRSSIGIWCGLVTAMGLLAATGCGDESDSNAGGSGVGLQGGGGSGHGGGGLGGTAGSGATGGHGGTGGGPSSARRIGTNFWNLGWGIWNDVFQPNVDFATATDPWNPPFLTEVSHYGVLRFMDFGQANITTEQSWSERTHQTDPPPVQEKLAYEWMIDLCNRTGTDMWVNVPTEADDDYCLQLATLIEAQLGPARKVYVEWSNETWNGGFPQAQYAIDQGLGLGLDADGYTAGAKYHVYRAIRMFEQFEAVFGANSPRVVKVIAGQSVNTWLTGIHLAALQDPTINPNALVVDVYAIAPYFGGDVNGNDPDAVTQLQAAVPTAVSEVAAQHDAVAPSGLTLMAYEGGQSVFNGADVVNVAPEMYDMYTAYLDGVAPYLPLFMHYLHNGQWSSGGAWGAERYVGQPLAEAHKLRAIFDWIDSHP